MAHLYNRRFLLFLLVLAVAVALAATLLPLHEAGVVGFDIAALAFLAAVAPLWSDGTAARLRETAAVREPQVLIPASAAVVVAVIVCALGLVMVRRSEVGPVDLALVVVTLALAWGFVNTTFAFHYAHLFYDAVDEGRPGGLEFPGTAEPAFADFCYFSFVLGMTFQVSDVVITAPALRKVAALHGLLAFFFSIGVLALTINVLAGLT